MGATTKIAWTTATFNPWRGCEHASPGCDHCYAEAMAKRNPAVLGVWGAAGTRVVAAEEMWAEPLKWNRDAACVCDPPPGKGGTEASLQCPQHKPGGRPRVFCASIADVFEDWRGPMVTPKGLPYWWCHGSLSNSPIPASGLPAGCRQATMQDFRDRLFQLIRDTPNLDWLLLTKRAHLLPDLLPAVHQDGNALKPLANVWVGVTAENQAEYDRRLPFLLRAPAAVRFVSAEPLLGPLDLGLTRIWCRYHQVFEPDLCMDEARPCFRGQANVGDMVDQVIVGGESGGLGKTRPMHADWARSVQAQCRAAGTAFFMKQFGREFVTKYYDAQIREHWETVGGLDWPLPVGWRLTHGQPTPDAVVRLSYRAAKGDNPAEWHPSFRVQQFPQVREVR